HRVDHEIAAWKSATVQFERELRNDLLTDENTTAAAIASVFSEIEFLQPQERKQLLRKFCLAIYVDEEAITRAVVRLPIEVVKLSAHTNMDTQFHDWIEITLEPDSPFKVSLPIKLNKFGIPEKKQYRSRDVAKVLGIGAQQLRVRFLQGIYPEVS